MLGENQEKFLLPFLNTDKAQVLYKREKNRFILQIKWLHSQQGVC